MRNLYQDPRRETNVEPRRNHAALPSEEPISCADDSRFRLRDKLASHKLAKVSPPPPPPPVFVWKPAFTRDRYRRNLSNACAQRRSPDHPSKNTISNHEPQQLSRLATQQQFFETFVETVKKRGDEIHPTHLSSPPSEFRPRGF